MPRAPNTLFPSLHTEGGLLPPDILARIADLDRDLSGLKPEDYHLTEGERLNEATNRAWTHLLGVWKSFHRHLAETPKAEGRSGPTRERWLLPLFQEFGYGRLPRHESMTLGGKSYPISHVWEYTPIHLVGAGIKLDRRTAGQAGAARSSPHSLVQEFLNHSDQHLWGFLSNGLKLRLLRDNVSLVRQAYVEFDLEAIFEGELYADFRLLWLLAHQSRVEGKRPEQCWLERWNQAAKEQGTRALDALRDGVETAIQALGSGFLAHPANEALSEALRSGALSAEDYYRTLLRLVYRLIFLFVAEDRELLFAPDSAEQAKQLYHAYYSTTRLRRLAGQLRGSRHEDLYEGLKVIMGHLYETGCPELALPALGSYLWSPEALDALNQSRLGNQALLEAFRALAFRRDAHHLRPVDYRNLGAEELGSVYESLLELHPEIHRDAATFTLKTAAGHERKTTGSYYTPTSLITELLNSALDPVLNETAAKDNPEQAILALKICDPAVGSGHFLVVAAYRIARKLAQVRTGDEEPGPEAQRQALRDIVGHCLYGVDMNPMAVELCKVSLWMEALEPGKPLSFLDHHILCGNSLLGTTPALIAKGIPDEAFKALTGDDKNTVKELKKRNRREHGGQRDFFAGVADPTATYNDLNVQATELHAQADDTIQALHQKETRYRRLQESEEYRQGKLLANAWCAAFAWKKAPKAVPAITQDIFLTLQEKPEAVSSQITKEIGHLANRYKFFHWHLEFPDVFQVTANNTPENLQNGWSGGFNVVLGNPPWERLTISEEEWFAGRNPEIAETKGKARRDRLIRELKKEDPRLYAAWQDALRDAEAHGRIASKHSGRYPLTGTGELNTYHLFAELADQIGSRRGKVGVVVKTGIGSANNCLPFFSKLTQERRLISLYDFVNTKGLFPSVQTVERFSLVTFSREAQVSPEIEFATICQDTVDLKEPGRTYTLSPEDIALMSPLNGAAPLLKGQRDAEIMRKIYRSFSILGETNDNHLDEYWNTSYVRIFDMATDSGCFKRREELEALGLQMDERRRFASDNEEYLPLYEGKYIYLMDHRYGTFQDVPEQKRYRRKASAPQPSEEQLEDPSYEIVPRYWFPRSLWEERARAKNLRTDFAFHFRDVAGVYPDLRTVIGAICSAGPAGDKLPVLTLLSCNDVASDAKRYLAFAALFNSLPFDYVVRNKLFSKSLKFNTLGQIPMPPPKVALGKTDRGSELANLFFLLALELAYTTSSLGSLGEPLGCGGPFIWNGERRILLLREIDAISAHLYGFTEEELKYVLSTFQTLEKADLKKYGDPRTKLVVLHCFRRMREAMETGKPYQTILDPPPADPSVAHPDTRERKVVAEE